MLSASTAFRSMANQDIDIDRYFRRPFTDKAGIKQHIGSATLSETRCLTYHGLPIIIPER
jgi:hypothetical protein